jgi:hypothetical protein
MRPGAAALVDALFDYDAERQQPQVAWIWIAGLYVVGVLIWAYFFGWIRLPLNFSDWADINVPRVLFFSNAVTSGSLPLHMTDTRSLHGVSDRFLSLPDVITTPQALLAPVIGIERFVLLDVILHYTIGVAGLLALRRRFHWSLFTFAVVFLLFVFNGHILSHYSLGHFTWGSYFLFPWVFVLCFQLLDGEHGWRWVSRMAFLTFYMLLAGGSHQVVWVLIFLGCLIPVCLDRVKWIVAAGTAIVLLGAVRLFPPALLLDQYKRVGWTMDVLGYPSVLHILRSMVELRRENLDAIAWPVPGNFVFFETNYHEFNYYLGVIGAFVVVYYGLYSWFRAREPLYRQLMVPTLVIVVLSIGSVFRLARATGIPVLLGERIVSRMLSLPMALITIMVGVFVQKAIDNARLSPWNRLAAFGVLALLAVDLSGEVRLMRVAESAKIRKAVPIEASVGQVANHPDPAYTTTIGASAAVTLVTAAGLLILSARERPSSAGRE